MAKKRPRTERRQAARELDKLGEARAKVAALEPGGAPDRPLEVPSASTVEGRAVALGCARCGGEVRLEAHEAEVVSGVALRRARTRCKACRAARDVWLRVAPPLLH